MIKEFSQGGVSFHYPDNWTLELEEADGGWTVTLQSKETAFFVITLDATMPAPEEMAKTALEALRSRSTRNWRPIPRWICWPAKWRSVTIFNSSASIWPTPFGQGAFIAPPEPCWFTGR